MVSSVIAVVLILVIFVVVSRPQYARQAEARLMHEHRCSDETCDRLGLRYLFNKTNQSVEPCVDFYERVCYQWKEGPDKTSFLEGAVDFAYDYIREKVYNSHRSTVMRNDVDQFATFLMVCLEDKSFDAPLSSWMKLIRQHIPEDFPVGRHWNWTRMIRAVIKHSLVNGLETILGVWVGRLRDKNTTAILVDGSLWDQFGVTPNDTVAMRSFMADVLEGLPEFENLTGAVDKILDIAAAIYELRTKKFVADIKHDFTISDLSKHIAPEACIEEINRHIHREVRVSLKSEFVLLPLVQPDRLFTVLESHAAETRAAYINLLLVGEVLRYRYARNYLFKPQIRVCMHASRSVFRHLWTKLVVDVANLQVQAKYLTQLFEDIKRGIFSYLMKVDNSFVPKLAVSTLVNKTVLEKIEGARARDDDDYGAPPMSVGFWMPQYLLTTMAFQAKRSIGTALEVGSMQHTAKEIVLPLYHPRQLSIQVPIFLLFRPVFYVYRQEQFHNFATVGVLIAQTMIKEAVERSMVYLGSLRSAMDCRIDRYFSLPIAIGEESAQRPAVEEVFIWHMAVGAALIGFESYTYKSMSPRDVKRYAAPLQRIFFERFCLLSCGFLKTPNITNKQRCTIPLMDMDAFATYYDCSGDTNMNQVGVCPKV